VSCGSRFIASHSRPLGQSIHTSATCATFIQIKDATPVCAEVRDARNQGATRVSTKHASAIFIPRKQKARPESRPLAALASARGLQARSREPSQASSSAPPQAPCVVLGGAISLATDYDSSITSTTKLAPPLHLPAGKWWRRPQHFQFRRRYPERGAPAGGEPKRSSRPATCQGRFRKAVRMAPQAPGRPQALCLVNPYQGRQRPFLRRLWGKTMRTSMHAPRWE
jgi:hypothetical protein